MDFLISENYSLPLIILWGVIGLIVLHIIIRVGSAAIFRSWWQVKALRSNKQKKEKKL